MKKLCKECGESFETTDRRRKFCSVSCYSIKRKREPAHSCFKPGFVPWNQNKKGLHLSPQSEFKLGHKSNKTFPVGSTTIRIDKNGKKRAWIKTAQPNTWKIRAQFIWEKKHGKIPRGLLLHHANRKTLDDSLGNLVLLSRSAHIDEHRKELKK